MLTLVQIRHVATSSAETASLVADYLAFDRRRTARRQYMKAFGGMAVIVLLGARVWPRRRSARREIVAGLLMLPPLALAVDRGGPLASAGAPPESLRSEVQAVRKS